MAKKEKFNLSTTQGLNVDYRIDTTRQGFNERGVYKGAINVQRSPLDALDILLAPTINSCTPLKYSET